MIWKALWQTVTVITLLMHMSEQELWVGGGNRKISVAELTLLLISCESKRQRSSFAGTYQDAKVRSDWMVFWILT